MKTGHGLHILANEDRLERSYLELNENFALLDNVLARYGNAYDLFFQLFDQARGYQNTFYDGFQTDAGYARTSRVAYDSTEGAYFALAAGESITIPVVSNYPSVLRGFYATLDTRGQDGRFVFEYSANGGAWTTFAPGGVNIPSGFVSLALRVRFLDTVGRLYSAGVLYERLTVSRNGEDTLSERLALTAVTTTANTIISIPNGRTYITNGKSLVVHYVPDTGASRLLLPGVDYAEHNNTAIRLLRGVSGPCNLVFRADVTLTRLEGASLVWTIEGNLVSKTSNPRELRVSGDVTLNRLLGRAIRISDSAGTTVFSHIAEVIADGANTRLVIEHDYALSNIAVVAYGFSPDVTPYASNSWFDRRWEQKFNSLVVPINRGGTGTNTLDGLRTSLGLGSAAQRADSYFVAANTRGIANGVATLGSDGKILNSQLPALAITDTYTAANEAQQLASGAERGDIVVRSDQRKTYVHNGGTAGTMADYTEMQTPTDVVQSVNGKVGEVVIRASDIGSATNITVEHALADLYNRKQDASGYNATDVLNKIKTVDGAGSGLDADFWRGLTTDAVALRNNPEINGNIRLYSGTNENAFLVENNRNTGIWLARIATRNSIVDKAAFLGFLNHGSGSGSAVVGAHNHALGAWAPLYANCHATDSGAAVHLGAGSTVFNSPIWHTGNFNPATKANADGGVITSFTALNYAVIQGTVPYLHFNDLDGRGLSMGANNNIFTMGRSGGPNDNAPRALANGMQMVSFNLDDGSVAFGNDVSLGYLHSRSPNDEASTISQVVTTDGGPVFRKVSVARLAASVAAQNVVWTGTIQLRTNGQSFLGANGQAQIFSNDGGPALLAFHRAGHYAINFGLDTDNIFKLGGWSSSVVAWQCDGVGNSSTRGNFAAGGSMTAGSGMSAATLSVTGNAAIGGSTGLNTVTANAVSTGSLSASGHTSLNTVGTNALTATSGTFSNNVFVGGEVSAVEFAIRTGSPTIRLIDVDQRPAFIHVNSDTFYVLSGQTGAGVWDQGASGGRWPLSLRLTDGYLTTGGGATIHGEMNSASVRTSGVTATSVAVTGGNISTNMDMSCRTLSGSSVVITGGNITTDRHMSCVDFYARRIVVTGGNINTDLDIGCRAIYPGSVSASGDISTTTDVRCRTVYATTVAATSVAVTGGNISTNLDMSCRDLYARDVQISSDARLKYNVSTYDNALESIKRMRGVRYQLEDGTKASGVIAQELASVMPTAVSEDENGMYRVAYHQMSAVFIEAIKELTARVERLEGRA